MNKKSHIVTTAFKEGIFLILPVGLTLWVINWCWNFLKDFVPSNITDFMPSSWNNIPYSIFLFDLMFLSITVMIIVFFGMIASTFLGKFVSHITEKILTAPTLIRPIYQTFKKVSEMIFSRKEDNDISKKLSQPIIVPYPNEKSKSIGFITADNANIFLGKEKGQDWITVYVPSAPLISAGFFLLCRKEDTEKCFLSASQAMTSIISVGTATASDAITFKTSEESLEEKQNSKKINLFRIWFLNGLLFITPVVGTLSILVWVFKYLYLYFTSINNLFSPIFSSEFPIFYQELIINVILLIIMLVVITLLGFIGQTAIGYGMKKVINKIFNSIPMLNYVYNIITKITEMFSPDPSKNQKFNQAVLVPYPTSKTYAIGFITGKNASAIKQSGTDEIPVFIPTTPIPTTGWFVFAHKDQLIPLEMPIEKAFGLVISAGILSQEEKV